MALKISFCPMRQKGQFCEGERRVSRWHGGEGTGVAHEIVDDGEVNLLGDHCCGLGDERRSGTR